MGAYDFELPFQRRLVAAAWQDGKLLRDTDVINRSFFTDELLAGVVETLQALQSASGSVPDLPAVIESLRDHVAPGRKWGEYAEEAKRVHKRIGNDLTHYRRAAVDFARKQAVGKAIEEAHLLVQDGELDQVEGLIRRALRIGGSEGGAVDFLDTSAQRFGTYLEDVESNLRTRIPSGIGPLDREIRGGVGPGEIACVVGLPGTGKSHTLVQIGTHGILTGRSVLHVSLENSREVTEARYDCRLLGLPFAELKKKPKTFRRKMEEIRDVLKGKLLVSFFPSKSLTLAKLEAHIETVDARPQVVVVDYAALLRPVGKSDEKRHQLVEVFEGLRGVAARTGAALWTAHQGNRLGLGARVLDGGNLAECFEIAGIIDIGITLNVDESKPAMADLFMFKNRLGKDQFIIKCEKDWEISKLTPLQEE